MLNHDRSETMLWSAQGDGNVDVQAAYRAAVSSSQAAGDSQQHLESLFGLVSIVSEYYTFSFHCPELRTLMKVQW